MHGGIEIQAIDRVFVMVTRHGIDDRERKPQIPNRYAPTSA
ncbi:MAG: hypothetical protein R3E12_00565 [Candidatus Eisenbacteria bacterium]